MSQEKVFEDFSGGMNALAAVDKLDPKECLLAENVRLDETGSIQSAGAFTAQNTAAYQASTGATAFNIHSLFWNPSLGAVAGVQSDIFVGPTLGSMSRLGNQLNANVQKMSFGSAYNRVYFDIGNVGYWTDGSQLLTVDWPPPIAGLVTTGPTIPGTSSQTAAGFYSQAWTNTAGILSPTNASVASINLLGTNTASGSEYLRLTMTTNSFAINTVAVVGIKFSMQATQGGQPGGGGFATITLLKNGVPVGDSKQIVPKTADTIATAGGNTDLWGTTWTQADINSGTLAVQITWQSSLGGESGISAYDATLTIFQASGLVAGTGTTGTLTGTYTWKVTFTDIQGEESDASGDSNSVILSAQQGTLTSIPSGDNRTTGRNVYRKGGTLTSYYLVGSIGDNLITTYSDNQTDIAALAEGIILAGDVPGDYPNTRFNNALMGAFGAPAGNGRFPTLHYDRIFWINPNKPNQIFWSKPLNGFAYPSVNFIDVGDGKPVARLVSIFGELIIIKTDSIWRLTGTDESSFDLTQTPSSIGTDLPFTVVALPDKVLFTNRFGFWIFNGYTSVALTTKLDLWIKAQNRTGKSLFGVNGFAPPDMRTVNVASATVFEAVGNSEKYFFIYSELGSGLKVNALMFDLKHGNITKRAVSVESMNSAVIDPVTGFIYIGGSQGFVDLIDDWNGTGQEGSAANLDYQHGYQDLQRGSNKMLWALEFFLNTNGQSLTPFVYYDNGAASETLPALSANGLQRIVRPVQATVSRKMQNFSWRLNGSINPVNNSGTPQIEIVHVKALYDIRPARARTGQ